MVTLSSWAKAQKSAQTPDDWLDVDSLAVSLFDQKTVSRSVSREALRLAIERLGANAEHPIEKCDPAETWLLHLLQAVWRGLDTPHSLRDSFFSLPVIGHSIDTDGRLLAVTSRWCEVMHRTPDDVIGLKSSDFLTEDSRRLAIEFYLPKFWREGSICKAAYDFVTGRGEIRPMMLSGVCEYDSNGHPYRPFAILSERT